MLRKIVTSAFSMAKMPKYLLKPSLPFLHFKPYNRFCSNKGLTVSEVPPENMKISASSTTVGQEQIDFYKTEGGISILDKVQGVKADNGQLFVLSFRCDKCDTQSIRSFTKHAYQNGVVLVKCPGCKNIHLVADNLGWFHDQPVNLDSIYKEKVKKVHDHVAIVKFLQKAFEEEPKLQKQGTEESKQTQQDEQINVKKVD